jgi:hypothetical protein
MLQFYSSIREYLTTIINPDRLVGLKQACFVIDSLVNRHSEEEITRKLGGDAQLARMWILFLQHNNWVRETHGAWTITGKGLMWRGKVTPA